MRFVRSLPLVTAFVVAACSSSHPTTSSVNGALDIPTSSVKYWVAYSLGGALDVDHTIGEVDEGRIACTVVVDPQTNAPMLVFSADANLGETRAPGVYFKIESFQGAGTYALAGANQGLAYAYEESNLEDCTRANDTSCYAATTGCTFNVDTWTFDDPSYQDADPGTPAGVKWGLGKGSFSCSSMTNAASSATITLSNGSFVCHAADWSAVSQAE